MSDSIDSLDARDLAADLRATLGELVRRLRVQVEGNDLTKSQASVLARLEREGAMTSSALARLEGIRPQSMGKIVAALEEQGLVAGCPDESDGRKTILSITDFTIEQYRTGRLQKEDWLTQAISSTLSAEELTALASVTAMLRRLAQSP
ncbi:MULTISPECIES: MarR family winged helix-turn-helix transcriptional regulator [unclassified Cryobacterium]|uniref:MarR family winged helix-turn-helix transcriptional regulator n=1 Tax=unclassified Cryobacterium TaxID=2649013 RepID=UPI002AB40B92|nr:MULTISPECIES: MarR family transcriptional regulator [unclassified Cryobacterium]MDY7543063.1 MarR family transcriptional regulator [Cryobacterium sp. 5B3]MEB0000251.1 MarR family transcriptional regulator [Cryobacterium sp. RTS3]MEB0267156.1 MarR family transcriptional regulator [Cryobacterium sp. 10I5]MEB0274486.1 MarR family transcriptional regulator [Cryobacterium sp. 5B3]